MTVYHPATRRSRGGPSRYGDYAIDTETGAIACPSEDEDRVAHALAEKFDLEASDVREPDTCETVKADGEVCGRDRPCQFHD